MSGPPFATPATHAATLPGVSKRSVAPSLVLWLFPLVIVAVVGSLLAGIAVLAISMNSATFGVRIVLWVVAPLVIVVWVAARQARRSRPEPTEGIEVHPAEHPALWAEVSELAARAETAAPDRIVIVPEVNASVAEAAGHRELTIGLPLLATMTVGELRSVLAHELGHFSGGDTAYAARNMRRLVFLHAVRARAGVLMRWFFTLYARLFAVAAAPDARRAEARADELSLLAAGPTAAADSFRTLYRATIAWSVLEREYVSLFQPAGHRASLSVGLSELLAANAEAIAAAADEAIATETTSFEDTHPPTRDRIARMEAARGTVSDPTGEDLNAPALGLLAGGRGWVDQLEGQFLAEDLPLADWGAVLVDGIRSDIDHDTDRLSAMLRREGFGDGGLPHVLALLDHPSGAVWHITGGNDDVKRDEAVETLLPPVLSALLAADAARIRPSWSGPADVTAPDGSPLQLRAAIGEAVDANSGLVLRNWLIEHGVDPDNGPVARSERARWLAAASQMTGPWEGRRDVHFWTSGVLADPPLDPKLVKQAKDQVSEKHQHPRLYAEAARGLDAGRGTPGALWWDASTITGGSTSSRLTKLRILFELADGGRLEMRSTLETASVETWESLGDALAFLTAPGA